MSAPPPLRFAPMTANCCSHRQLLGARTAATSTGDARQSNRLLHASCTARDMTASTFFFLVQSVVAASAQAQCLATAMSGLAPVASVYSGHEPVDAAGTRRFQRAAALQHLA